MFLFPWLHYGESMIDFEKSTFFDDETIFHPVRKLRRAIFDVGNIFEEPVKNLKIVENSKKIEFCKKFSKVSVDSFVAV